MKNLCKIVCPICNSGKVFNYFKDEPNLKECKDCKIVFAHPFSVNLTAAYDEDYYKPWHEKQFRQRVKMWRRRLKIVRKFYKAGKLLDVGTGDGLFLKVAKEENFNICGTEISPVAVGIAKNLYNLDVHLTEIENVDFEENSFDVCTIWHVIEHVKNPIEILKKVYELLKPGAVVFVATPNLNKYVSRMIYRLRHNKPYPFYSQKGEPHLLHFTEYTLEKIIKKAGFKIISRGVDFASVKLKFKILEYMSFILSTVFRKKWNENILLIAQK
jgi:2-polyprenyl-3-methyl-5-hydroxy-6-metoxy-1,4-benzoquinol methylase